jgi:hypothetical protein
LHDNALLGFIPDLGQLSANGLGCLTRLSLLANWLFFALSLYLSHRRAEALEHKLNPPSEADLTISRVSKLLALTVAGAFMPWSTASPWATIAGALLVSLLAIFAVLLFQKS